MAESLALPAVHADAGNRSAVYRLISRGFRYPTPEIYAACQTCDFFCELFDRISSVPHLSRLVADWDEATTRVWRELKELGFRHFETEFVQTFEAGAPAPPCPPYEGLHRGGERTAIMLQVSEFYKHFGLSMSQDEGKRELPDHLCVELEFMHFLAFKEAQARREGNAELLRGYVLAQRDFLDRHLTRWLPQFADKLREASAPAFFGHLAEIAARVSAAERDYLDTMVREVEHASP